MSRKAFNVKEIKPTKNGFSNGREEFGLFIGFRSALINTLGGIIYFLVILVMVLTGQFNSSSSGWYTIIWRNHQFGVLSLDC